MSKLLPLLRIKYKRVGIGEYRVKARLPSTRSHRNIFIPFVAALEKRNEVVMLTHDETNMTVNLSQPKAYVDEDSEALDDRRKTGAGLGMDSPSFSSFPNNRLAQELGSLAFST